MKTLIIQKKGNYAIIKMNRGRSNPINMEMVNDLRQCLVDFEADDQIAGIILTGQTNFFSVGLDIIELYDYEQKKMEKFWINFTELIGELIRFPKPMIAAISGHSPAGGCILALCADYRIMVDQSKFKIGLNEIPVGVVLPSGILSLYGFWLGMGKAYQMIMEGTLVDPEAAQSLNLVDRIVSSDVLLSTAEEKMRFYLSFNQAVWRKSKQQLRKQLIEAAHISAEAQQVTLKQWWSKESREILKKMVGRLCKKV